MKARESDIKQLLNRICSIVGRMLKLSGMIRGSFGTTYRRCGKPTCWCADTKQKGHQCTRLVWADENGSKTRSIRNENVQTIADAVEQYRQFKQMRRQLRTEAYRLEELLVAFERQTTSINRAKLDRT